MTPLQSISSGPPTNKSYNLLDTREREDSTKDCKSFVILKGYYWKAFLLAFIGITMLSLGKYSRYKNYSNNLERTKRFKSTMRHLVDNYGRGKDYGDYNDVYWVAPHYILTADSFQYKEKGENPTSMANAIAYEIGGDPRDSTYHSIEQITWYTEGNLDRRLHIYLYSDNGSFWYSNEARTYDKTGEEWMFFDYPEFYMSGNVDCFHSNKLEVTNEDGDTLTFVNLDLLPFIQSWSNPVDTLTCVNGALLTLDVDEIDYQTAARYRLHEEGTDV